MIHKKALIIASILVILPAGCARASVAPTVEATVSQSNLKPVDLQVGNKRVSLTLVQNDKIVPITVQDSKHAVVTLAPDTFAIRLEGNKEATYIVGQADQTLLRALESYTRPLATFDAGYPVFENNDLWIFDPSLEFSDDLESFFAKSWGSPEQGRQIANDLKGAFGTEPVMIYGGFMLLDSRSGETGYTIRTIQGSKPTVGRTLFITIFLGDGLVGKFDQLAWFTFSISFAAQ